MARRGLQGLARATRNLNKEIRAIKNASLPGLLAGALVLERGSKERTPVEFGILKASQGVTSNEDRDNPKVALSTSVDYAIPVHERLEVHHPVGQAKFMETAMNEDRDEIIDAIHKRMAKKR